MTPEQIQEISEMVKQLENKWNWREIAIALLGELFLEYEEITKPQKQGEVL